MDSWIVLMSRLNFSSVVTFETSLSRHTDLAEPQLSHIEELPAHARLAASSVNTRIRICVLLKSSNRVLSQFVRLQTSDLGGSMVPAH